MLASRPSLCLFIHLIAGHMTVPSANFTEIYSSPSGLLSSVILMRKSLRRKNLRRKCLRRICLRKKSLCREIARNIVLNQFNIDWNKERSNKYRRKRGRSDRKTAMCPLLYDLAVPKMWPIGSQTNPKSSDIIQEPTISYPELNIERALKPQHPVCPVNESIEMGE